MWLYHVLGMAVMQQTGKRLENQKVLRDKVTHCWFWSSCRTIEKYGITPALFFNWYSCSRVH